jgi:hypothetical protein
MKTARSLGDDIQLARLPRHISGHDLEPVPLKVCGRGCFPGIPDAFPGRNADILGHRYGLRNMAYMLAIIHTGHKIFIKKAVLYPHYPPSYEQVSKKRKRPFQAVFV